eukprot:448338-Rhodomonas_salina.1
MEGVLDPEGVGTGGVVAAHSLLIAGLSRYPEGVGTGGVVAAHELLVANLGRSERVHRHLHPDLSTGARGRRGKNKEKRKGG